MVNEVNYEQKALLYANDNGIIAYDVKGNTMSYEEQVQNGLNVYGIYNAQVNLDTMDKLQTEVELK